MGCRAFGRALHPFLLPISRKVLKMKHEYTTGLTPASEQTLPEGLINELEGLISEANVAMFRLRKGIDFLQGPEPAQVNPSTTLVSGSNSPPPQPNLRRAITQMRDQLAEIYHEINRLYSM